jgi:hypothetical protein
MEDQIIPLLTTATASIDVRARQKSSPKDAQ